MGKYAGINNKKKNIFIEHKTKQMMKWMRGSN